MSLSLDQLTATEIIAPATGEIVGGYVALPVCHLKGGGPIPFEIYLKVKGKNSLDLKFLLLTPRNEVFSQEWSEKLDNLKVSYIYFLPQEQNQVLQYLLAKSEELLTDNSRHNLEKTRLLFDAVHIWMRHFYTMELDRTGDQLDLAQHFVSGLYESVLHDPGHIHTLRKVGEYGASLYHHSLQVCILGLSFVSYLGWAPRDAHAFGLGALLHDLGMTQMPRSIWAKKGPLTGDEKQEIARHPILGARLLQNFSSIRREALLMIQQHHENGDGSGYPRGLRLEAIHPWAQILRILDSYEGLTAALNGHSARSPQKAVWIMRQEWQEQQAYDPEYFRIFIEFLAGFRL